MIQSIIEFSVRNKVIIGVATLALIVWGMVSATRIPIDAVPDITNNQVQVITISRTLAAQEMERFVTYPIEIALRNIPGVIELRSISRFGLSVITVVFEEGMDIYLARQLVNEQLEFAQEDIPAELGKPTLAPISSGLGEIYQYVLQPQAGYDSVYSPTELRSIQDWMVRPRLAGTPGVVEVNSFGGFLKQYEIAVNPERLIAMHISISDILDALQANNANVGGSYIEKNSAAYFVRGEGLITSLEDIRRIPLNVQRETPLLIGDVAEVRFGNAVRFGALTRNGNGEAVGGIVMMLKGENSAEVVGNVKERMAEIQKTLPEGIAIEAYLDRATLVERTISTVGKNLIAGGLIVIFVLVLFLGNLRAGFVVASVIPLSMLFALGMMNIFGISANLMSLGALDFGLVVDGAVIIVEAVVSRMARKFPGRRLSPAEMDRQVIDGAAKIRRSVAFGELIILIVYLPILSLVGIEGKMFHPMAMTVGFAILGALLLSLTYVPAMAALVLPRTYTAKPGIADRLMDALSRVYISVLSVALKSRQLVIAAALLFFALALFVFSGLGGEFMPQLDEGDLAMHVFIKPGSSLTQMVETTGRVERALREDFPEVTDVVSKIGSTEIPTDPMPMEIADVMIILAQPDEWTSAATKDELIAKMKARLEQIPGVKLEFSQPIEMRFHEMLSGSRSDVAVKLYGEDMELLNRKATEISAAIGDIPGVSDMNVERTAGLPQIVLDYRRESLARYGVSVEDVNNIVRAAFAGEPAGMVLEGEQRYDIVVRYAPEYRRSLENIREAMLPLPNGAHIPLREVADVRYKEGPMQVSRDDSRRRVMVGVNVRGRDVQSVVEEMRARIAAAVELPPGYELSFGGAFENLEQARNRLLLTVPVALGLIFMLLFLTFNSIKQTLLIYTSIPFAAIGGVFALGLRDMPFSISAGVGFIALFGVAVLNGIVLMACFNDLEQEGVTDPRERALRGAGMRLRPVLMTALVASLGFLPMALSTSAGAEVQKPLATVVIGGVASDTLLTLIVLPVLYSLFPGRKFGRRRGRKAPLAILTALCMLSATATVSAQEGGALSLDDAIAAGLNNNPELQAARYNVKEQEALGGSAFNLGKTEVSWELLQNEGITLENRFEVRQNIPFPGVFPARADMLEGRAASARQAQHVTERLLVRDIRGAWYNALYYKARLELLRARDTLDRQSAQAEELRFGVGGSTALDKVSAETRLAQTGAQILQAEAQVLQARLRLQQLTLLAEFTLPEGGLEAAVRQPALNTPPALRSPGVQWYEAELTSRRAETDLRRAEILPDFSLAYINLSQEQRSGIHGFALGISLPLLFTPMQAGVDAARYGELRAEEQLRREQTAAEAELNMLWQQLRAQAAAIRFYEEHALLQAETLHEQAATSFRAGEHDYLSYARATDQVLDIRLDYLEALHAYTQSLVSIQYLSGE